MALLPSTLLLWRLRRFLATGEDKNHYLRAQCGPLEGGWPERFRELRTRYQAAVCAYATDLFSSRARSECETIFLHTWRAFSTLPAWHALHLRPLFEGEEVLNVLRSQARLITTLELLTHDKGPGIAGTSHTVLGGSLGVGKTYILRGVALVASILCTAATPITFNYESAGASLMGDDAVRAALVPPSLLLQQFSACTTSESDDAYNSHLAALSTALSDVPQHALAMSGPIVHEGCIMFPLLLLDAINTWYRTDAHALRGKLMVQQLQHFGRRPNVLALVSGSSVRLREQVFGRGEWAAYPTLNATLFSYVPIAPLRSLDKLDKYLQATGTPLPDELTLEKLLSLSGGVGRVITDLVSQPFLKPRGRLHPCELFLTDASFAMLVTLMFQLNGVALDSDFPPPLGLEAKLCETYLRDFGHAPVEVGRMLDKWCDGSVLLRSVSGPHNIEFIEFLYPYHAKELYNQLHAPDMHMLMQASIQLHGVTGSVGQAVEALCRPRLHHLFMGCVQRGGQLVSVRKVAMYQPAINPVDGSSVATAFEPADHLHEVIEWKAQVGIEDFVLERDEEDPSVILIDGWQCKAPAVGTVMTASDLTAATEKVIAAKGLGAISNAATDAAHAIVKAQWGFCLLVAILSKAAGSDVHFVPRTLFLCTTAVLQESAGEVLSALHATQGRMIDAFNASTLATRFAVICPASLQDACLRCEVRQGVEWVDELFPPHFRGCFRTPLLLHRLASTRAQHGGTTASSSSATCSSA